MITKVDIENYKSLENLSLELGRFNVLIGENGCGKSNILESLVFVSVGFNSFIENSVLALRGSRTSEAKYFKSGFDEKGIAQKIKIKFFHTDKSYVDASFENNNQPFSGWYPMFTFSNPEINKQIDKHFEEVDNQYGSSESEKINLKKSFIQNINIEYQVNKAPEIRRSSPISKYIIYAPENFFLRNITINETYLEPVGFRGEGLLKLIKVINKEKPDEYQEIIRHLSLIDWFEDFDINEDFNADSEFTLSDKYLEDGLKSFDIRNANEGFLFVLFYLTIFISNYTPKFFAIDNIDTALNPKLCSKLISVLVELAKKHDKQVIISTHNPSVLDGLNLNDDEQRLFVIARNKSGRTRATRIEKKPALNNGTPIKLSEQFLRGYLGGLPKNF